MDTEKQRLKEELLAKYGKALDEILVKPMVTLEEMEDAVAETKAELGRELLEKMVDIKKTQDKKKR